MTAGSTETTGYTAYYKEATASVSGFAFVPASRTGSYTGASRSTQLEDMDLELNIYIMQRSCY